MADCWLITEIKISGFRGFVEPKNFLTSEPLILFDGPQRAGKSSTLTAIEWCLFGNEVAKKAIGIDERRGWEIRNTSSDEAIVEITLKKGNDILKIFRSDKRRKGNLDFYFELNGVRDSDENKLRVILGIQPKDYFSSIHLHQEIIRALLTEEPASRRDSLDRLLGLSELRNILEGIKSARINETLKDTDTKFGLIESNLNAVITSIQTDIKNEKEVGIKKRLTPNDFSESGANKMTEKLRLAIITFASEAGIAVTDLLSARSMNEQLVFADSVRQSLRKLRDEQPDLKRQKELLGKQSQLQNAQQAYKDLLGDVKKLQQDKARIFEAEGNYEKISSRITELNSKLEVVKNKRNEINRRAGTIEEAIKYFEGTQSAVGEQFCPVCEKPIDDPTHLQRHLKEFRKSLDVDLAPVSKEIDSFEKEINRLQDLIKNLNNLNEKIAAKNEPLRNSKSNIEALLGYKIKDTDDPIVVVSKELENIDRELKVLESTVSESNKKLNAIEDDSLKLGQILKILVLEAKVENLLKIKETDEFKKVEQCKSELEKFSANVDLLDQGIYTVLQTNAKVKLEAAKNSIANTFRDLADRPDFSEIEIDPNSFEILALKGEEKLSALAIFNQGDLNCAGLSIFLGLGATQDLSHNLGFIILDDPSQSLDSSHKENLIKVLDSIPDTKQIFVATSEFDLSDLILKKVNRRKKHYRFAPWSEMKGAQPEDIQ